MLSAFFFNWCNAILTDKLTRAKEEGLSVKQMLDQTLMEMVNLWPSHVASSALNMAGSYVRLFHIMLGLMFSMCPLTLTSGRKELLHKVAQTASMAYSSPTLFPSHTVIKGQFTFTVSLIGLPVYVGRICTFVGKNTAHNHREQSHTFSQGYVKGTFIMCTFVKLLVCIFFPFLLYYKHSFSVGHVVRFQFGEEGILGAVAWMYHYVQLGEWNVCTLYELFCSFW